MAKMLPAPTTRARSGRMEKGVWMAIFHTNVKEEKPAGQ